MAAFGSLYVVGAVRVLFGIGVLSSGPAPLIGTILVSILCLVITAASLAEVASAIPLSGSIYIWAGYAGGPKYGRFFAFIVAFWSTTAWTSFVAGNSQATTNYILSEMVVFNIDFPGGVDYENINFRALAWIVSELFLFFAVLTNYLSPKGYRWVFKASFAIIFLDLFITVIYLPIGVARTYGFQPASFLATSVDGTGGGAGWSTVLAFLATSGILIGFDASGHVAEETQHAGKAAARGIFWSSIAVSVIAFPLMILFLFCSPDLETLAALAAPQSFVLIYQLAFGSAGQIIMTTIATVGLFVNTSIAILAASRLVFAIARDGILPGSSWIGKVDKDGQPKNAVLFVGILAAVLLCPILGSAFAFTSLVSAGAVPTIAAYALIPLLRLTCTPGQFKDAQWSTGRFSTFFCIVAVIFNTFLMIILLSPYSFPVTALTFNFAIVIFGSVTIFAIISYFLVPEELWLARQERSAQATADLASGASTRKL